MTATPLAVAGQLKQRKTSGTPEQISELYQIPINSDPSLRTGNFLNLDIGKHWAQVFAKLSGEQGFEVNNALLAEILWYRHADWTQSVNVWIADDNMSFGDYKNFWKVVISRNLLPCHSEERRDVAIWLKFRRIASPPTGG